MATIYNSDLSKELREGGKIQILDSIPNQLADKVVPVMEVNPKLLRRINIVKSADANNATSTTIYTTPTDQDFYLVAAYLATIKDATSTSTSERILATVNGASTNILRFLSFTLTAETRDTQITFPIPLKLDRGTTVTVNNGTGNANISTTGAIFGYVDELSKA